MVEIGRISMSIYREYSQTHRKDDAVDGGVPNDNANEDAAAVKNPAADPAAAAATAASRPPRRGPPPVCGVLLRAAAGRGEGV